MTKPGISRLLVFGVLLGTATAGQAQEPHLVRAGIPADYSEDVTAQLLEFIASVPDGSTIVFPEGAKYRMEGTLAVSGRRDLTFEGNGATFRAFDRVTEGGRLAIRNRAHWRVNQESRGIVIRNVTVIGAHPDPGPDGTYDPDREAQHGFDIDGGARDVRIEDCRVTDVYGDGVYVRATGVVVRGCVIRRVGRQGISVTNARDVLIENNEIGESRRGIIDIEAYARDWHVENVRIIGNRTGRSRLLWMPMGGAGSVGMVCVADNVMEAGTGVPVIFNRGRDERRGPFIAVNNTFVSGGSPAPAFRFEKVDGVFFAGNEAVLPEARRMSAVELTDARGGLVAGNLFKGAAELIAGRERADVLTTANEARGEVETQELAGGFAVRVRTAEGEAIAIFRGGSEVREGELSAFDLTTDAELAWVWLDADGAVVRHYVHGKGRARYRGRSLPVGGPSAPRHEER